MTEPVSIVWYKRDLRVTDHRPLATAASQGAVLPLYIIEPSVIHADDYAARHWMFTRDSLHDLCSKLADLGMPLVVRRGDAVEVFEALRQQFDIKAIYAHEETGNDITYARDRAVKRWGRQHDIPIHETPNGGVVRPLPTRDHWARIWDARMQEPIAPTPDRIEGVAIATGDIPTATELGLTDDSGTHLQVGGSDAGRDVLLSFLYQRGSRYHREMSSPVTADTSCSRLSAHLAYGTLSLREVVVATRRRRDELYAMPEADYRALDGSWKTAMKAFWSRLHWRDHFIQKLEDEPEIEQHSFLRAYDGLRDDITTSQRALERYTAYCEGRTGYPLVDACMRYLRVHGWINFRMRAMLTSFASNDLWLNWQQTGLVLARLFTDYEPGIHWSQMQMQSSTTGINTLRTYNPSKQAVDQDPDGVFIREWVPELANVPTTHIHRPWKMPRSVQEEVSCIIGVTYPPPIVDHAKAVRSARAQVYEVRKRPELQDAIAGIVQKHGSRRGRSNRTRQRRKKQDNAGVKQPKLL